MKPLPTLANLEDKDYGPDCSKEELAAIKSWVYLYDSELMVLKPIPRTSEFVVQIIDERIRELSAKIQSFDLILDLTSPHQRPNAKIRDLVRRRVISFGKVRQVKAVTGANWLANIAAQFIFNSQGLPGLTVYRTFEQALEALGHDVGAQ